jgi:hypothetical protein
VVPPSERAVLSWSLCSSAVSDTCPATARDNCGEGGRTGNGSASNGERLFTSASVRVGILSSLMSECFSWVSLLAG